MAKQSAIVIIRRIEPMTTKEFGFTVSTNLGKFNASPDMFEAVEWTFDDEIAVPAKVVLDQTPGFKSRHIVAVTKEF